MSADEVDTRWWLREERRYYGPSEPRWLTCCRCGGRFLAIICGECAPVIPYQESGVTRWIVCAAFFLLWWLA